MANEEHKQKFLECIRSGAAGIQNWNDWYQKELDRISDFLLDLSNIDISKEKIKYLHDMRLTGANLSGADFSGSDIINSNMGGADLSHAKLIGTNFQSSEFAGTNFTNADLSNANFKDAKLMSAILTYATFSEETILSGANLQNTLLEFSTIKEKHLNSAINTEVAVARKIQIEVLVQCSKDNNINRWNEFKKTQRKILLFKTDFSGMNLAGADLSNADISSVLLCGANISYTNFTNTNIQNSDFSNVKSIHVILDNTTCDADTIFTNAILKSASIKNVNLKEVQSLESALLSGADLTGSQLPPVVQNSPTIEMVRESGKVTKHLFSIMMIFSFYIMLSTLGTNPKDLILGSGTISLPISQTTVEYQAFFTFAPLLLIILYAYFHIHLTMYFKRVSTYPAKFPDNRPLDEHIYPWMFNHFISRGMKLLLPDNRQNNKIVGYLEIMASWTRSLFLIILGWLIVPSLLVFNICFLSAIAQPHLNISIMSYNCAFLMFSLVIMSISILSSWLHFNK